MTSRRDDLDRAPAIFKIGGFAPLDLGRLRSPELIRIGKISIFLKYVFDDRPVKAGKIEQGHTGRD
jgi:hypothetical protein